MNTPNNPIHAVTTATYRRFQIPIVCVVAALVIAEPRLHGTAKGVAAILAGLSIVVLAVAWSRARLIDRSKLRSEAFSPTT